MGQPLLPPIPWPHCKWAVRSLCSNYLIIQVMILAILLPAETHGWVQGPGTAAQGLKLGPSQDHLVPNG